VSFDLFIFSKMITFNHFRSIYCIRLKLFSHRILCNSFFYFFTCFVYLFYFLLTIFIAFFLFKDFRILCNSFSLFHLFCSLILFPINDFYRFFKIFSFTLFYVFHFFELPTKVATSRQIVVVLSFWLFHYYGRQRS
jgi:hypothetical protein